MLRYALASFLILAACGGSSKKAGTPPPPPPPAVATCDDAAMHVGTLPPPADAGEDPVEFVRTSCATQGWDQALIDCMVGASSWDAAAACFPRDPLCVRLDELYAAGADGKFASLRGEPDDPDEPMEYASTTALMEWPCSITPEDPDSGEPAEMSCEVLTTVELEAVENAYSSVATWIGGCLPGWSPEEGNNGVDFTPPEFGPRIRVWAGSFNLNSVTTYYVHVDIGGAYPDEW